MMKFALIGIGLVMMMDSLSRAADMPKAGDMAPDFKLKGSDGREHSLADYSKSYIALYFYPKNNTPGCTAEACNLRDNFSNLKDQGVVVLGVSYDSEASHQKFRDKHNLPFTLLADTGKTVSELYGVKGMIGAKRTTFLIAPGGKIVHVFDKVDTSRHAEQIMDVLKTIKK